MFTSNGSGAFSVSLPNGYDVSVAFGSGNYCSNRDKSVRPDARGNVRSPNAEIAVFKTGTNDWVDLNAGEFDEMFRGLRIARSLAWVRPAHFVQLIAAIAALPDWRTEDTEAPPPQEAAPTWRRVKVIPWSECAAEVSPC